MATVSAVSNQALPTLVRAQSAAGDAKAVAEAMANLASGDSKAGLSLQRHLGALRETENELHAAFTAAKLPASADFAGLERDGRVLARVVRRRDALALEIARRLETLDIAQQEFRRKIRPILDDAKQQVASRAEALVAEATEAARLITGDDYALVRETYAMLADANLALASLNAIAGNDGLPPLADLAGQFEDSCDRLRSSARKLDRVVAGQNIKALVTALSNFGPGGVNDVFAMRRHQIASGEQATDGMAVRRQINAAILAHGELTSRLGRLAGLGRGRMLERTALLIDLARDATEQLVSAAVEGQSLVLELSAAADLLVALLKEATIRGDGRLGLIETEIDGIMSALASRRQSIERLKVGEMIQSLLDTAQPKTVIALRRQELQQMRSAEALVDVALERSKRFARLVQRLTEIKAEQAAEQARSLEAQLEHSFTLLLFLGAAAAVLPPLVLWLFVRRDVIRDITRMTEAMRRLAGGELDLEIAGADRSDELGDMAKALVIFRSNARNLKVALEKERELNGLQRQFVSMVSHEFRTPLAVIDGYAYRLTRHAKKTGSDQVCEGLAKIRISVRRLTELMESVLSAARLEEGRIKFEPRSCDLAALVTEVCGNYAELNPSHRLVVDVRHTTFLLQADEKLLRQIVSNLVSNAIKYSPTGSHVWIEVDAQPGEVVVTVRDEGIGIPEDEQARMFERFFRARTSTGIAGSGIGLHLAQHLATLHDGRIEFDSVEGRGTSFRLRLPLTVSGVVADERECA